MHRSRPLRHHARRLRHPALGRPQTLAQPALPAGAAPRRAVFGLLDADGWGWAGLKAAFWFLVFVFLSATSRTSPTTSRSRTPSRSATTPISPINWCPARTRTCPCPAPAGAVLPWQPGRPTSQLPEALTGAAAIQSGSNLYVVGGSAGAGPTADVSVSEVSEDGNLPPGQAGPALPEPRRSSHRDRSRACPTSWAALDASGDPPTPCSWAPWTTAW